jgi:hypothetical protein
MPVSALTSPQGLIAGHGDEGVEPGIQGLDRPQMRLGQRARGERPLSELIARRGDRQIGQAHSTTFGTAK